MSAQIEVKAAHKSLATALAAAQMEMGKALKSANNPHFKSKYADLSSVTDACLPALNRNGIGVIQPMGEDEHGRYVETVLIHGESGDTLSCRVPLIVAKNDMQGYGSAVTYGRRYGLMSMAGIAPEDDDGNAAAKAAPIVETQAPAFNARAAADRIIGKLRKAATLDDLAEAFKAEQETITDIKATDAAAASEVIAEKDTRKAALAPKENADLIGDGVPY